MVFPAAKACKHVRVYRYWTQGMVARHATSAWSFGVADLRWMAKADRPRDRAAYSSSIVKLKRRCSVNLRAISVVSGSLPTPDMTLMPSFVGMPPHQSPGEATGLFFMKSQR